MRHSGCFLNALSEVEGNVHPGAPREEQGDLNLCLFKKIFLSLIAQLVKNLPAMQKIPV